MDFKIVELMDRSIASVAVCPVFIVHFKLHIEKCYLQSGMDTILLLLIEAFRSYSIVLLPQEEIHTESGLTSRTWAQRDCLLYLWTCVCVAEWGKDCFVASLCVTSRRRVQNKRRVCRGCADQRSSSLALTRARSLLSLRARDHL